MSTIIQLQGLDTKASAEDIRSFFVGIHIPEGGVFIFGGELGEAFIAFNTEEDGMLAIQKNGLFLKDSKVHLHMSNLVELECHFDKFLKRKKSSGKYLINKKALYSPNEGTSQVKSVDPRTACNPPPDTMQFDGAEQRVNMDSLESKNAFFLGLCTLLQELPSSQAKSFPCDSPAEPPAHNAPNPGFIRLFGLPYTTSKEDICLFFHGLNIKEVLLNVSLGVSCGCLVKFDNFQDATNALSFNRSLLGSACVEVRQATEKMWNNALRECEDAGYAVALEKGPLNDMNYSKVSGCPGKKRNTDSMQNAKKIFKTSQNTSSSSDNTEHIVMVSHLPMNILKTEIKELFGCPNIAHANVLHLLDSEGKRTDKAFVKFNTQDDYDYAVNLNGCHVGSNAIKVLPITREEMNELMRSQRKPSQQNTRTKKSNQYGKMDNVDKVDVNARNCLYIRNMPADVRKSQIKGLFTENKLKENDITLLHGSDGMCIGEAVVQFQSQTNVAMALMHHGREFLGNRILLTPISVKQMDNILATN